MPASMAWCFEMYLNMCSISLYSSPDRIDNLRNMWAKTNSLNLNHSDNIATPIYSQHAPQLRMSDAGNQVVDANGEVPANHWDYWIILLELVLFADR